MLPLLDEHANVPEPRYEFVSPRMMGEATVTPSTEATWDEFIDPDNWRECGVAVTSGISEVQDTAPEMEEDVGGWSIGLTRIPRQSQQHQSMMSLVHAASLARTASLIPGQIYRRSYRIQDGLTCYHRQRFSRLLYVRFMLGGSIRGGPYMPQPHLHYWRVPSSEGGGDESDDETDDDMPELEDC